MAHAGTPTERGVVPKNKDPVLAGVVAYQEIKGPIYRLLLGDRVQTMINREGKGQAQADLEWFLNLDPREPLKILDSPAKEWGQLLVLLSPTIREVVGTYRVEEDLRPATKAELTDLKESRLHEWLHLVVANQ